MSNSPNKPPGAPYNPFDPTESRPIGGYPSEFAIPGTQTNSGTIQPATEFQRVKNAMNHLGYHPRPRSTLYPGQYKLLRKIDNSRSNFWKGVRAAALAFIGCSSVYIVFFHRWNDGYDNMFSPFYRFQLKFRWFITGKISKEEYEDLFSKRKGYATNGSRGTIGAIQDSLEEMDKHETRYALQRPSEKQLVLAESKLQKNEESYLRAVDLAEETLKNEDKSISQITEQIENNGGKSSWWKWF